MKLILSCLCFIVSFEASLAAAPPSAPATQPTTRPIVQAADGAILLHARDVTIHGKTIRYEPQPNKNTIGYWTKKEDWVSWDFTVKKAGTYEVEILQGCGKGSGNSKVDFTIGEQRLEVTVQDTGGFQNFIPRKIGSFKFDKPGNYSLQVKPITKPGLAVMDLRSITLTPLRR